MNRFNLPGRWSAILISSFCLGLLVFSTTLDKDILENSDLTPLFQAAKEATSEAIHNSLFMATTTTGQKGRPVEAIPLDRVKEISKKYRVIDE